MIDILILLGVIVIAVVIALLPTGKCPYCGGKLKKTFYDAEINRQVYECEFCHKKYI